MRATHTFESVKEFFTNSGCKLLSTEFKNSSEKLKYICKCGETKEVTFHGFQNRKTGCRTCVSKANVTVKTFKEKSKSRKITYEIVKKEFEDAGCTLLSKTYSRNNVKLQYICSCGETMEKTYNCFQYKKGCMKCTGTPKYTYSQVKDFFEERDCVLLSKTYESFSKSMDYICECGNTSKISLSNLIRGHRCRSCRTYHSEYTTETVKSAFEEIGYILNDIYTEFDQPMRYTCINGCKKSMSLRRFKKGQRCCIVAEPGPSGVVYELQGDNEPRPSGVVSTFDYSSLVQNSNETSGFKSDLLQELNNQYDSIDKLCIKKKQTIEVSNEIQEINEPGPSGLVYEEIPNNQLQFEGIFKGKESEIRITPDKRISVFDFIRVVGGQKNPKSVWERLTIKYKNEVVAFCDYSQFGKTKKTPVINVKGMVKLLFWLPGEMAKQFRAKSAEVMIRYLGGDLTLINEIKQIDNHHSVNPNNVAQIFRNEIQPVQNQSNFNQDQINNSKRLLENFGDKKNVMYNLIFNHKDFGWLSKIGIVRELRGFYNRFKEHQDAFGEVCIHSVLQCTNIEQVEKDFKDTSLFQTNKVKVPKNDGDGNYTEIIKLSELVTSDIITNEIKRIAGSRTIDPPPMYIENIQVNSLEIEKEKTRQIELQEQELTKREQIKADLETKKLEFEILKFKVANNIAI